MGTRENIRVVIADDHPTIRRVVRQVLRRSKEIQVVGEASNGLEAVQMVERMEPDVLILDINMPLLDGIEVIETLRRSGADVAILVLSAIDDVVFQDETISLGACGFVCKDDTIALPDVVEEVAHSGCSLSEPPKDPEEPQRQKHPRSGQTWRRAPQEHRSPREGRAQRGQSHQHSIPAEWEDLRQRGRALIY